MSQASKSSLGLSPGKISRGKQDSKLDLFREHIPASPSILHVGCVGGEQTDERWMHRRLDDIASSLVGIDVDKDGIERMKADGWDAIVADAHEFDLGEKFDIVAVPNVIEHLHSPGQFLQRASEHLEPWGTLLVSTPRTWSLHHLLTWMKDGEVVVSPDHTMWFDDPTFRRLVDLSPFEVTRHETFRWQRSPASRLDQSYLLFEALLKRLGIGDRFIDYQHFYSLEL